MARYTDDSRERVRDAVDFAEVVGARTELRRAGVARLEGLCPFHDERSPSFGINPTEKVYYCFGCGAGGDVFKFVMETENLNFGEALESLAERYRVPLEREAEDPRDAEKRQRRERLLALLERTAAYYVRVLWESPEAADARAYLESRGLSEQALRAYRVGFAPDTWDRVVNGSRRSGFTEGELLAAGLAQRTQRGTLIDRFRGRVTFPLADERGRVLGFGARAMKPDDKPKYLNTSESDLFHKGRIVYGADMARAASARAGRVVLVEGYTDVIALHQAGVPEVVAQMGTALTDQQVEAIARLAPKALFCQDPDRAGQESVAKGIAALRTHNAARTTRGVEFRIVRLPAGQDPADVAQTAGGEALRGMLEKAVAIERFEVERALEQPDASADEILAVVAPIIAPLRPSKLKDELVKLVDGKLGMGENLVNEALRQPFTAASRDDLRGGGMPGRGGNPSRGGWSRPPQHQQPPQQHQQGRGQYRPSSPQPGPAAGQQSLPSGQGSQQPPPAGRPTSSQHPPGGGPGSSQRPAAGGPSSQHPSGGGPSSQHPSAGGGSSQHPPGGGSGSSQQPSVGGQASQQNPSAGGPTSSQQPPLDGSASRQSSGGGPASSQHPSGGGPGSSQQPPLDGSASRQSSGGGPASSQHPSAGRQTSQPPGPPSGGAPQSRAGQGSAPSARDDYDGPPPPEWDGFSGEGEEFDPGAFGPPADFSAASDPGPAAPPPQAEQQYQQPPQQAYQPPPEGWNRDWQPRGGGGGGRRGGGGGRGNYRGGGGRDRDRDRYRRNDAPPADPIDPRAALNRREENERVFLAFCIALPEHGEKRLADVDVDDYFAAPSTRRAAAYLRGRLRSPMGDIPSGDDALAHTIAALVVQSGRLDATPAKLELEDLQMQLNRLDRHIRQAQSTDSPGIRDLAAERHRILDIIRHKLT